MVFQESDYYKEKSKHRYKIEAKNSELKNVHGYNRATSYGIENMQMQGAMAIFAVNLKRIPEIIVEKSNLIAHFSKSLEIRSKITTKKSKNKLQKKKRAY